MNNIVKKVRVQNKKNARTQINNIKSNKRYKTDSTSKSNKFHKYSNKYKSLWAYLETKKWGGRSQ